jgi:DNA-binding phage protein
MKHLLPPLSADIPDILREELERTRPLTPEMLAELAKANRALEADPEFQADFLKSLFVEKMLEAMEERDETKAQVADRLGKTRQYVQKLFNEDKRVNFTVDTLCAVAHALGRRVHLHVCKAEEEPMIVSAMRSRTVSAHTGWPTSPRPPAPPFANFIPVTTTNKKEVAHVSADAA